jgi:hypothetical protein
MSIKINLRYDSNGVAFDGHEAVVVTWFGYVTRTYFYQGRADKPNGWFRKDDQEQVTKRLRKQLAEALHLTRLHAYFSRGSFQYHGEYGYHA